MSHLTTSKLFRRVAGVWLAVAGVAAAPTTPALPAWSLVPLYTVDISNACWLWPQAKEQTRINANVAVPVGAGIRNLCVFATGDPRDGQWALARMAFSK